MISPGWESYRPPIITTLLTLVDQSISRVCLHRSRGIKNSMCALKCLFKGIVFGGVGQKRFLHKAKRAFVFVYNHPCVLKHGLKIDL